MPRILIADDERSLRVAIERFVRSLGMDAMAVSSGEEAMMHIADCDVLVSDVRMPGIDGIQLLREARRVRPQLPVVILTGNGTVGLAVEAMRSGAANFLTKPFDLSDLEQILRGILDPASAQAPERQKPEPRESVFGPPPIPVGDVLLGSSPAMVELRDLVSRVAPSEATVLVTGESGVGKEVVARAIHRKSRRAAGPFVAVNCAAIPETLIESELFGHVKGAFTGASQTRPGRFAQAKGGTLLLDEIGELPLSMQVKLLRVLQERSYTPVGGSESEPADVRVIAATHRDLEAMVAEGSFREDLFWRLNVVPVTVPPLRERGEDVVELARTFLAREAAREGRPPMALDADAMICLGRYRWPGNVRELEHALTRAVVLANEDSLSLVDLPPRVRAAYSGAPSPSREPVTVPVLAPAPVAVLPEEGLDLVKELFRVEKELIRQAMIRTGGNKNRAAALLKLNRTTLVEKIKRYALAS